MTGPQYESYAAAYSESRFRAKIFHYAKKIGVPLVYKALQLFYVAQKPEVPVKVRVMIYGALGYLVLPFDLMPDVMPVIGYGDDLTAVLATLAVAQIYVDDAVRDKAGKRLAALFGAEALEHI